MSKSLMSVLLNYLVTKTEMLHYGVHGILDDGSDVGGDRVDQLLEALRDRDRRQERGTRQDQQKS